MGIINLKNHQSWWFFYWRKRWDTTETPKGGLSVDASAEPRGFSPTVQDKRPPNLVVFILAEAVGFEPTIRCRIPDFESGPL